MPLSEYVVYRVCDVVLHLFFCELRVRLLGVPDPHFNRVLHRLLDIFIVKSLSIRAVRHVVLLGSKGLHGIESASGAWNKPVWISAIVRMVLLMSCSDFKAAYDVGLWSEFVGKKSVRFFQA